VKARFVAEKRCEIEKAVLVKGSATPDIESLYGAYNDDCEYLRLKDRIHQGEHPELVIVDKKKDFSPGMFSKYLLDRLEQTFKDKRQSIIFLNRRGFSTAVVCKECGENIKCPNCNITQVFHSGVQKLKCHWCDHTQEAPRACPSCGGSVFKYRGVGTERVEAALNKIFPEARVVRMDLDTTSKKGSVERIFKDFKKGKYDIMVGTQIVAKGWDFSNVDLVGVINSDVGLMVPDFRAAERTYTLLRQVEGRAGRGENRGEIIIQTYNPGHYSIKKLFEKEYSEFYNEEIEIRKITGFPPFSKLINIMSTHKNEKISRKNIYFCRDFIQNNVKGAVVLGPAPAPMHLLNGMYRWQLMIKHEDSSNIKEKLRDMLDGKNFTGRLKIDVDPQDML
jgi:primosomal protein N' (replication factor Y)